MNNGAGPLSLAEEAEFTRCKGIVDKGLSTFCDVGMALLKIRDNKWYRSTHKTFEAFCQAEWGMSRPRAYELLNAASIVQNLSAIADKPTRESQVRPLTSLSADQQREVWKEATKTNNNPTAKQVKAAVEKVAPFARPKLANPFKVREGTAEVIRLAEAGVSLKEISAATGVTPRIVDDIIREEKVRRSVEPTIDPQTLSLTAQQKLALAIKQELKRLAARFQSDVSARVQECLAGVRERWQEQQDQAKRIIERREGFMSKAVYNNIRNCLHPDRGTHPERENNAKLQASYNKAFRDFIGMEKFLLNEKDSPTSFAPPLPRTAAEWAEAKRRHAQAQKAKREAGSLAKARQRQSGP